MSEQVRLAALLHAGRDRAQVAAYRGGQPVPLAAVEQRVRGWHAAFAAAPGQRYVLHSADALEFAAALLGAWHAGKCVLVPSDAQLPSIARAGIAVDGTVGVPGAPAGPGALLPATPFPGELPAPDPEAPCMEIYTSGSTGQPAAIPKCLRQLEAEVAALARTLDLGRPGWRVLGTVSHQHMYGLVFRVLLPLATGRPFEALRLPQVQDLARVNAPGGCVLVSSPAQLTRLPAPGTIACPVGALLTAGGPLGDEGVRACQGLFGVAVTEIYGSSETGAVAFRARTPGVAGPWQPLPGVQFRTREGVLEIQTRQLPAQTWFRSADRVVAMKGGGFELAGRVDRIVKVAEKRVSLDALERVLLESGLLAAARALVLQEPQPVLAVAAAPNAAGWAVVQEGEGADSADHSASQRAGQGAGQRAGKRALVERLRAQLRRSGEIEAFPKRWRFLDPWPVNADGKTPESLLREHFDRRNPEFRVLEQDAAACRLEVWVSPTAPCFAGHFPGLPILPGVVQIDWLVWLTRTVLGHGAGFAGLEAAKFRRAILPESRITVTLSHDAARHKTTYQIVHAGEICASGRIRWEAPR